MRDPQYLLTGYYRRNRKRVLARLREKYRTDAAYRKAAIARAKAGHALRKSGVSGMARAKILKELAGTLKQLLGQRRRGRPPSPTREARRQVMLKLRLGKEPLTAAELVLVPPRARARALVVRPRTTSEIAILFALSSGRVSNILLGKR